MDPEFQKELLEEVEFPETAQRYNQGEHREHL